MLSHDNVSFSPHFFHWTLFLSMVTDLSPHVGIWAVINHAFKGILVKVLTIVYNGNLII